MIAKLRGLLDGFGADFAVIDVGGVGYLVYASSRTLSALGTIGEEIVLHTEMLVAEDFIRLVGFATAAERDWFRLLTSVQGVGARVALAILSALSGDELHRAVASGDNAMIARSQGVGPKLAQRIVHELKDKAGSIGSARRPVGAERRPRPGRAFRARQSRLPPRRGRRRGRQGRGRTGPRGGSRRAGPRGAQESGALAAPDLAEQADEIVAHHLVDPRRAPAAAAQIGGDPVVAVAAIIALDIEHHLGILVRRRDAAPHPFRRGLAVAPPGLVVELVAEERIVGADADMVLAADVDRMVEMAEQILLHRLAPRRG